MLNTLFVWSVVILCTNYNAVRAYEVVIKSTAPAVIGSRVNFTAELHEDGAISPSRHYTFVWSDSSNPQHTQTVDTYDAYSNFSVTYNASLYSPDVYQMTVTVRRNFVVWIDIARGSIKFNLNDLLTGNLTLSQNGTNNPNEFVSTKTPVKHTIHLNPSDAEYVENATEITTYWYRNCNYLGPSPGLSYIASYDKENETYDVEAFVVVSFEKIEPTTTTTTTTTTTSTTTTTTTTSTVKPATSSDHPPSISSSEKPNKISTDKPTGNKRGDESSTAMPTTNNSRTKRDTGNTTAISPMNDVTTTLKPKPAEKEISVSGEEIDVKQMVNTSSKQLETTTIRSTEDDFRNHPDSCVNITEIYHDPKKVYGYFRKRFVAKTPVGNLSISGSSWLQYGELLNLQIKCTGSKPLGYCIKIIEGPYNATGNETCAEVLDLETCNIAFRHLFTWTNPRTILVIVQNSVNKVVNQVAVNFYKATKQSQLSVIVVPVSFILVAVIIVVFGVAYYIQNRNRYIIEVADFNFGDSQSVDMEYKTFHARLFDSIREVIPWPRRHVDHDAGESHSGDDSSIKYGSMT